MTVDASLGPIQYIVLGFPGNKFKGEIIPALGDLVQADVIRVMDLAFVKKDADGSVLIIELEDLANDEAAPFGAFERQIGDLLNEEDLLAAAAALEPWFVGGCAHLGERVGPQVCRCGQRRRRHSHGLGSHPL
jgi:hypothetical protein